jgi:hypothetical protein
MNLIKRFWLWLAFKLPKQLIYFCIVCAWAEISASQEYSDKVITSIGVTEVLKFFDNKYNLK